jgi:penicillin amidase
MSEWSDTLLERARAGLPPVEGEVRLSGLREPVEVIRDRWGVPHIYARNDHDLWFAQGYVTASERLFQIDFTLRFANGRLATLLSEMALPLDRFVRTIGLHRGARRVVSAYTDQEMAIVEASLGGINAWIETMPAKPIEYEVLDLDVEPFPEGKDGAAYGAAEILFMCWALSTNWDAELLRAEIAATHGWGTMTALFPEHATEPAVVVAGKDGGPDGRRAALDLLRAAPLLPKGMGSNNWVVAGSRSVTGKPLLANDPHLLVQMPGIWFEAHLSSPSYEASGVTLGFAPGVVIGHTAHHAWGFTNVGGDTMDLYLERLNDDRTNALYEGRWEPLTIHREEIEVRGRSEPEVLEVLESRHGPIVDSYMIGTGSPAIVPITETYALRWTAFESALSPTILLDMARARDFGEFREALRGWDCPGQNVVYADVDGNIGYQCTGKYPLRLRGDGTVPVPGWTAEYDWDGWVPFEELPWAENPAEGFLATANAKIHDDSYPYLIGKDWLPPHRVRRIVELLTETERHSAESFARMQMDTVSIPARRILPFLLEVEPRSDRQKEALSHLAQWDADLDADSIAACVYEVWGKHIGREVLSSRLEPRLLDHYWGRRLWTNSFLYEVLPEILEFPTAMWFGRDGREGRDDVLRRALDAALDELTGALGEDMAAWRWGALHKVRFVSPLAIIPDLTEMLTGGVVDVGGDESTIRQSHWEPGSGYDTVVIPSWRQIVDLSDIDASLGVHTTGQSGNPSSPHYRDFVELWATGRYHPLPFTRPKVEEAAEATFTLVPGA